MARAQLIPSAASMTRVIGALSRASLAFLAALFICLVQTAWQLQSLDPSVLWLGLVAAAAGGLLMTRLRLDITRTLWVWLLLFVFLAGYFSKNVIALYLLEDLQALERVNAEWAWLSQRTVLESHYWILGCFIALCCASWLTLELWPGRQELADSVFLLTKGESLVLKRIVLLCIVLSCGTAVIQIYLGIGMMGVATVRLPLRLDTVLFRLRSDILPAVLLLCLWLTDQPGWRRWWTITLLALVGHQVTTGFMAGSRGTLVWAAIPVLFLWLLTDRVTRRRKAVLGGLLAVTILLFPLISLVRYQRINNPGAAVDLRAAFTEAYLSESSPELLLFSSIAVAIRLPGADSLWYAVDNARTEFSPDHTFRLLFRERLTEYYTREIVGVAREADFRSPGLVGGLLLLVGKQALPFVWLGLLLAIDVAWVFLSQSAAAPILLTLFCRYLLQFASEGSYSIDVLVAFVFVAALCRFLYWLVVRPA